MSKRISRNAMCTRFSELLKALGKVDYYRSCAPVGSLCLAEYSVPTSSWRVIEVVNDCGGEADITELMDNERMWAWLNGALFVAKQNERK